MRCAPRVRALTRLQTVAQQGAWEMEVLRSKPMKLPWWAVAAAVASAVQLVVSVVVLVVVVA